MEDIKDLINKLKEKTAFEKFIIVYACIEVILSIVAFIWWEGMLVTLFLLTILQVLEFIKYNKHDKKEASMYRMSAIVAFIWFLVLLIKKFV